MKNALNFPKNLEIHMKSNLCVVARSTRYFKNLILCHSVTGRAVPRFWKGSPSDELEGAGIQVHISRPTGVQECTINFRQVQFVWTCWKTNALTRERAIRHIKNNVQASSCILMVLSPRQALLCTLHITLICYILCFKNRKHESIIQTIVFIKFGVYIKNQLTVYELFFNKF